MIELGLMIDEIEDNLQRIEDIGLKTERQRQKLMTIYDKVQMLRSEIEKEE